MTCLCSLRRCLFLVPACFALYLRHATAHTKQHSHKRLTHTAHTRTHPGLRLPDHIYNKLAHVTTPHSHLPQPAVNKVAARLLTNFPSLLLLELLLAPHATLISNCNQATFTPGIYAWLFYVWCTRGNNASYLRLVFLRLRSYSWLAPSFYAWYFAWW